MLLAFFLVIGQTACAGGLVLDVLWAIWWIFVYYNTTICHYPFGLSE
jgi:hypothetical protein